MERKESNPMREAKRRYEETHKEERKARNAQFATFIPRAEYEEIDAYLKRQKITKVEQKLRERSEKDYKIERERIGKAEAFPLSLTGERRRK